MAKITAYIPEPKQDYEVSNQRQIIEAIDTLNEHLTEMKNDFSSCLGKDRLYHKPCGFLND